MSRALGAEKGERIERRLGFSSGYYVRSLSHYSKSHHQVVQCPTRELIADES
jgi:hypothetical protein